MRKWNCRHWAPENSHCVMDGNRQYRQTVNVWPGLINNTIVGHFFIEDLLNGNKYLELLRHHINPVFAVQYSHHQNPQLPNIFYCTSKMESHHIMHDVYANTSLPDYPIDGLAEVNCNSGQLDLLI